MSGALRPILMGRQNRPKPKSFWFWFCPWPDLTANQNQNDFVRTSVLDQNEMDFGQIFAFDQNEIDFVILVFGFGRTIRVGLTLNFSVFFF